MCRRLNFLLLQRIGSPSDLLQIVSIRPFWMDFSDNFWAFNLFWRPGNISVKRLSSQKNILFSSINISPPVIREADFGEKATEQT
jgi:hypothetical protein